MIVSIPPIPLIGDALQDVEGRNDLVFPLVGEDLKFLQETLIGTKLTNPKTFPVRSARRANIVTKPCIVKAVLGIILRYIHSSVSLSIVVVNDFIRLYFTFHSMRLIIWSLLRHLSPTLYFLECLLIDVDTCRMSEYIGSVFV